MKRLKKEISIIIVLLIVITTVLCNSNQNVVHASDLDLLKANIVDFYTLGGLNRSDSYIDGVVKNIKSKGDEFKKGSSSNSMKTDGSYGDINYSKIYAGDGAAAETHYGRMLYLAQAYTTAGQAYYKNKGILSDLEAGLSYIKKYIYDGCNSSGSWVTWEIRIPERLGPTLALVQGEIDPALFDHQLKAMRYCMGKYFRDDAYGANGFWGANIWLIYGVMAGEVSLFEVCYERAKLCTIVDGKFGYEGMSTSYESLKPDFSFHAHQAQLYNGGYGAYYPSDAAKYIAFTKGTEYALPSQNIANMVNYLLEGLRWSMEGLYFDLSAVSREASRTSENARDGLMGMIAFAGMSGIPRQSELIATAKYFLSFYNPLPSIYRVEDFPASASVVMNSSIPASRVTGHKYYNYSDYSVHKAQNWFASLKMYSSRVRPNENTNEEGKKFWCISDGVLYVLFKGDEYYTGNVRAAMNWSRLPGTTVEQFDRGNDDYRYNAYSTKSFVGGATIDNYGASAMDFDANNSVLTAKKSYFFFDNEIVCLGTDINCPSNNVTETVVNQWPLKTKTVPVYINGIYQSPARELNAKMTGVKYIQGDNIGYYFPGGQTVNVSRTMQTGSWKSLSDLNTSSSLNSVDFLTVWYDHGRQVSNQTYSYAVVPGISNEGMKTYAASNPYTVLKKTSEIHAVQDASTGGVGAVFWKAGSVDLVSVDQPCIVFYREKGGEFELSLTNPNTDKRTITVVVKKVLDPGYLPEGVSMKVVGNQTFLTFNTYDGYNFHCKFGSYTTVPSKLPGPFNDGTNLALDKKVTSDSLPSTQPANVWFEPKNACDGTDLTRWFAGDKKGGHWIKVDLGANAGITGTEVKWGLDPGLLFKYKIEVSVNDRDWVAVVDKSNTTEARWLAVDPFTYTARYVKVTVTTPAEDFPATIAELRVRGAFVASQTNTSGASNFSIKWLGQSVLEKLSRIFIDN